jgi:hypothetical protein
MGRAVSAGEHWPGTASEGDGDEIGEREQRAAEGQQPDALRLPAFERDRPEPDVGQERNQLGREPAVDERVLAQQERHPDPRREEQRVVHVGENAGQRVAEQGVVPEHPDTAQDEPARRHEDAADVQQLEGRVEFQTGAAVE